MTRTVDRKPKHRLSRAPEAAILGVAILIVLAISALSYSSESQTRARVTLGRAVRDTQKLNAKLLLTVTNAETGERGFLLTGEEQYLEPYHEAVTAIPKILESLETRAKSEPDQEARIRGLAPLVSARIAEIKHTVDLKRAGRLADALAIVGAGKQLMEEIRSRGGEINRVAEQRQVEFSARSDASNRDLRIGTTVGSVLLLGLVSLSAMIISRGFKRREELFEESQATRKLLATTLSSIADAVISTDIETRVTFMNPVAERLTGWKNADAAGRKITEVFCIVSEATREPVTNPLEEAIKRIEPVVLETRTKLISRAGTEIFIDDSAAPICDADGDIMGAVLIFRDISEQRAAEMELVEAAEALARSNEELQHFAFAASHDLRSPLNSVNAIAQMVAQRYGDLDAEGKEMIGYMTEGLARMSRLVEDLLALALASSSAEEITRPANMEEAFDAALRSLSAEVQESGAVITSSGPLPLVAVQETHVVQVLQNILGNALKYRGQKPPAIHVSATHQGNEWIIGVKDNGIGFDPQYEAQIFQPFKRLHGREYEGTGIGLATCKKIVSIYGGRIWAESAPDKGATFWFSMPEADAELLSKAAARSE